MSDDDRAAKRPASGSADSTGAAAPADVLDWDAASQQYEMASEMLGELARMFLEESPKWLAEMRQAMSAADAPALRRAAHTLKSSAAIFAARRTTDAALRLEQIADGGDLSQASDAYETLESEVDRLRPLLAAHAQTGAGD